VITIKVTHPFECPPGSFWTKRTYNKMPIDVMDHCTGHGFGHVVKEGKVSKKVVDTQVNELPRISKGALNLIKASELEDDQIKLIKPTGKENSIIAKDVQVYLRSLEDDDGE